MANNRVVVNFDFKANTRDVQSNLNALKNNLLQIQTIGSNTSSFLGINQGLKQASIAAQQLQTHLAGATNPFTKQLDLSMFSKSLQSAGLNVTQLSNSLLGAGATGQQAFKKLALTIASAQAPALQLNATMGKLMTTFANNARWMVSSSVLTGFVSSIREAVDYTKDLNESLTDIRIVTGKSKEEMDGVARSANRMAKELKTSTAEIVKGQLIYYQQGDSAELAAKKAEITTKAANVSFGTSQEQMSEYLTAIWNSYQVGEEDLEQFVDVLAAVGATTATSTEEIATAMQKVAATGNAVGVSYEQLTATIATISSITRISSEQVGTALKTIYARIGDLKAGGLDEDDIGLGQVSSGLKKVGVEILDTNNNVRDMGEVVEEIGGKWEGWTEAQQQAIVQLIAGKRQYTQMMALFEHWDMYESTLATAEGADGELNKQQEIWAESWEAASQNVQASLESIYTKVFDDDVFIDLLNILNGIIVTFDTLTDAFGGIGPILMQISALLIHHFKVPILDAFTSVRHGLSILTGNAQKAHEQMRNQFFQGIDFSQMDSGLKMEIQSLGQLTEIQDRYKLNMSQIHKADRLQIENSIEITQALRNQALAQQEVADKQKQSISNTIAASKASASTKKSVSARLEKISTDSVNAEMSRNILRNAFQTKDGKYNPAASLQKSKVASSEKERTQFLVNNQEKFNSVLQQTEKHLQNQIKIHKEALHLYEQKLQKEALLEQNEQKRTNVLNEINRLENLDSNQIKSEFGSEEAYQQKLKELSIELNKLNTEHKKLATAATRAGNAFKATGIDAEKAKQGLQANEAELKKVQSAMNVLSTVTKGGTVSSDDFKNTILTLNKTLQNGSASSDQFVQQFRELGVTLGLSDDQLDAFVKEVLEMISLTAAANMSQEEFQRKLKETADRIKEAGDSADRTNKKINGESLMNAASAMMSMSSAVSSISSMFKTFGDESASAVDKVTSATGALTQGIFAVIMAMKMLKGANGWLIGITIALSLLPIIVEGIDAIWETQTEKVERLKKETEELTEKYNEQKAVIDELQTKKEAGVDNQAQLNALDEEIIREQRKLKILEEQKKVKEEETNKEENKEIENKFNAHGTYSSKNYTAITHGGPVDASQMRSREYESGDRLKIGGGAINVQDAALYEQFMKEYANYEISKEELLTKLKDNDVLTEKGLESITTQLDYQENLHSEHLTNMLQDIETYTEQGGKLTENMLYNLQLSLKELYGGDMTSDAITQLGSYISGIDEMSDKELQSLLEKLFPNKDKDELVERFRQTLREADGEIDEFGKNQTLAKSIEDMGKAVEKVQSAFQEVSKSGFLAYSTIEEMGKTMSNAGVIGVDEWKQKLFEVNGNAKKTKEVLGQIAGAIADATIEQSNFDKTLEFDSFGKLTAGSQQYVQSVEKMVAAQLRENGVLNAEEEAHKRVIAAVYAEKIAKQDMSEITEDSINALITEAASAGADEGAFKALVAEKLIAKAKDYMAENSINALNREAAAAIATAMGYKMIESAKNKSSGKFYYDPSGGFYKNKKTGDYVDYTYKQEQSNKNNWNKDDWVYTTLDKESQAASDTKVSIDIPQINYTGGSDGGKGKKDPAWKIEYEKRLEQIEYEAERDGLTKLELGRKLRELYNEYYGHMFDIEDEKTGKTYEKYFFDKAKDVISNLKGGLSDAFDKVSNDAERTGVYDYTALSNLLSDTFKKAAEEGVIFSEDEKNELIDKYVNNIQGLMSEASSDLDTKFENQEFFSGIINLDEKMAGYDDLLKTTQDYLKELENNGATVKQLAEYENSVIIPLIKKKRDLLKEEADAAKEATEHYIKQREFYGYKNGDNEIKARERTYKRMLNLTQEQILAEYGTYQEYWYALEEKRLEIDQIFRDKLKEALEKEKDDRIAILEAEKNAAEKLYEGENTLREKRKQINDQLQESLTMYQYLDKATRKLIFNEEDYLALSDTLNEIEEDMYDLNQKYLRDIVGKEADELEYINAEYERQNELLMNRYEIAEKELGVIKARTELENTLKERNTQMFINGRWQWVADQKAVIEAQKKLNDAEFDLETSELENEQELLINSFEKQIDDANKAWEKATKVLEDKVMTVAELMGSLSEPMDDLTAKFYELATGKKVTSRGEQETEKQKSIKDAESELAKDTALAIIRKKEEYDMAKAQGDMTKAQEIEEQAKASYQVLRDLGYNELAEELHKSDLATAKKLNLDELTAKKKQTEEVTDAIDKASDKIAKAVSRGSATSEAESKEPGGLSMPKGYDPNFDYQAHINKLTAAGAPASEINYWKGQREKKIKGENLNPDGSKKAAEGTRFAAHALYEINEIGEETFVTPDGHFRNFAGGEVVFTHEQSQRLFSLLNADLFDINKMPRMGDFEQSNSNDTYISIGGISVDTTTQDGKDVVEILQRITNI